MSRLAFVESGGRAAIFDEELARLDAAQDGALYLCFGDEPDDAALVSMLLVPGQPLYIEPPEHAPRERTEALVARCAQALGYVVARVERRWTTQDRREARDKRREGLDERRKRMEDRRGTPSRRRDQESRPGA
jgi:hypothetical protein